MHGQVVCKGSGTRCVWLTGLYVMVLAVASIMSHPVDAFEIFGVRFFEKEKASEQSAFIDPKHYSVTFKVSGNEALGDDLKSASQLWLGRERPVAGQAGLLARIKKDYRNLTAALYNAGYYGGTISIQLDGVEAANLPPAIEVSDQPIISIHVETGGLYTFGRVEIEQEAPIAVRDDDIVQSVRETGLMPEQPAKAGAVRRAGELLIEAWRQQGFAKAAIAEQKVTAEHPARKLNVKIALRPGRKAVLGDVRVEGAQDVEADFLTRQTGLKAGQEYDPDDLEKAKQRINRLDVLSSLKLEEADALQGDGSLPITLIAQERKKRRVGTGATVSNVDGVGLEAFWLHRNLFGRAERLRVGGEISGLGQTFDIDELDYQVDGTFTRPGVFDPDVNLTSSFIAKRQFNDTFEETSIEARTGLTYFASDTLTLSAEATISVGEFEDAFGTRDVLPIGLVGSAIYDGRDNKLEPTKGLFASTTLNPFYEAEFGNAGVRLDLEGRTYRSFGEDDRFTLAARGRWGTLIGPEREETAADQLFFTGGGGSVRGYGFKTIGVTEADGSVTGGRSLLEGSFETRFRATDSFGGVVFVDAGIVGEDSFVDFEEEVSVGVGAGVRYFTGIGAIRLDVGVPLNRGPDDPPVAFYAGIGQTF